MNLLIHHLWVKTVPLQSFYRTGVVFELSTQAGMPINKEAKSKSMIMLPEGESLSVEDCIDSITMAVKNAKIRTKEERIAKTKRKNKNY